MKNIFQNHIIINKDKEMNVNYLISRIIIKLNNNHSYNYTFICLKVTTNVHSKNSNPVEKAKSVAKSKSKRGVIVKQPTENIFVRRNESPMPPESVRSSVDHEKSLEVIKDIYISMKLRLLNCNIINVGAPCNYIIK